MTRKNILYIGNKLSKHGNTTTVIETLSVSLSKEGFGVVVVSDKKNQVYRMLDMVYETIQNRKKVDFVLIDTYSTSSFYYALIVSQMCRVFKLKYVPILHGGNLPNRLKKSPYWSKMVFENAYLNVAPSRYLMEAFLTLGYKNIMHIPNTIELEKYNFQTRIYDVPKILWVRSFSKIYNPKMAIDVYAELKKEYPDAILCMVGPDKENVLEECLQYAKKMNVEVEFTGKLSKEQWVARSEDFNVFINTTHFDNMPVSVIEAMALGLPIVSTNVGGIPFLLTNNENAFLVEDGDCNEMVKKIKHLFLNTKETNQMTINARNKIKDFDWESVKQNWFEILR